MPAIPAPILFVGLLLPPILSFLYASSVLAMYTGFYEWTVAEKMPALLWRFALLGGAAAVAYSDRYAGEVGTDLSNASRLTMLVIQSALLWTLSAY